ncbi:MAG: cation diffusion facilitator family transporter [Planctomycetota bacterium]|jgi:cation diffusion facilitator family transporter|nr:cation diffusion facilitator family transporter [Planctomycetota bacterium]
MENRQPVPSRTDTRMFFASADASPALAREVSRVTWTGLAVNAVLAVLKAAAGLASGSHALLADAVHTLSDLATDAAILVGVRYWCAPADADHPHGHRKIEALVTFGIGLILAAAGLGMGWRAAAGLAPGGRPPPPPAGMNAIACFALATALLSIAGKEWLYRWTAARGLTLGSSAVMANAWHHRSDAFSSIPPALAIAGSGLAGHFGRNLWFLDELGALVVCVLLLQAAWGVVYPTLAALIDAGADRRLSLAIREAILATPKVAGTHHIRTRSLGNRAVAVDLHIAVDPRLTVREGHDIAADVKYRVLGLAPTAGAQAVDVLVHVEPDGPEWAERHPAQPR